ncbi:glycosyltransferase [Sandarakinorhabdus sp. AAP62]|uniref:glycosyltransferase family 2 protein n=1 Tax=Sandarakinorhabdus sp. AAP62 TaxID=1248916 RepID=UPI000319FCF6|nr:glycosyltransferase [Sandarakinorhabdus sp. AAP62]
MNSIGQPLLGVVIVAFHSADVIGACIRSLLASVGQELRIVVVDNASPDDSTAVVAREAQSAGVALSEMDADRPYDGPPLDLAPITIIRAPHNLGYAGGCNLGLALLRAQPAVGLFWVLNPDCEVLPDTAAAFGRAAALPGAFGLMGGRIRYQHPPNLLQSDGGRIRRWTGVAENVNKGLLPEAATLPDPASLDFISGAAMVASRAFIDQVGLMADDYFLYYEEIDWAARRGTLPFRLCSDAIIYHHTGTSIGSGSPTQRASAFSHYFNYRNRLRFMLRFRPLAVPATWAWSMAAIAKLALRGEAAEAMAALRGLNQLPPPSAVRARLSPAAALMAFGR